MPKKISRTKEGANQARAMAQYGVPEDDIAASLDMSKHTLINLYAEDMRKGRAFAKANIGKTLYDKAAGGDITAAIFYAKTQMGWREKSEIEHSGEIRLPNVVVNYANPEDKTKNGG